MSTEEYKRCLIELQAEGKITAEENYELWNTFLDLLQSPKFINENNPHKSYDNTNNKWNDKIDKIG